MTNWPPFTLNQPRYSNDTFFGRLLNISCQLDPSKLLVSDVELDKALNLLELYKKGELPSDTTNEALWRAAELKASRIHPDTNEKIPLPLCFACYTPMQPPIIVGMLWPGGSVFNQAWWQFVNQSYNAGVFFANKNKSSEVSDFDVGLSYAGSVTASIGLGVGMKKFGASIKHPRWGPLIAGWAGFAGCVGAGWASLILMRRDELANGVNILDMDGTNHGQSQNAAREGIAKCCASRVVWNIPATGMTPLLLAKWHSTPMSRSLSLIPKLAVDASIVTFGIVLGVYPGQALFTQRAEIPVERLEKRFQNLKRPDGTPIKTFFFNKGL